MTSARRVAPYIFVIGLAVSAAACGSPSDESSSTGLSADAAAGKSSFAAHCAGCHSIDGKSKAGPTLKALSGSTVTLQTGESVTADDAYITKSITDPSADIVKGYQKIMESAVPAGSISEQQAKQITAYIDTLK